MQDNNNKNMSLVVVNDNRISEKRKIELKSERVKRRNRRMRFTKIILLISTVFLFTVYFVLGVVYETGAFTITLDPQLEERNGLVMYERKDEKIYRKILKAERLNFMDNISVNWLPQNLNTFEGGSHNGENYIAYTFYIENQGAEIINYWYSVVVDDVIRNVDRAIRIMIYHNDEKMIYAKANEFTGNAETGTKPFYSKENPVMEQKLQFKPGDIDKFTIVIWLEGDDPDCVDALIGGEMKMHMDITEEHIEQKST